MKPLEMWLASPWAQAVGWTLIHSLWQGIVVAAGLATLSRIRSARVRYAAACLAMLIILTGTGATFIHLMPDPPHSVHNRGASAVPAADVQVALSADLRSPTGLAAIVPWLAPIWVLGVWIFAAGQVAGWVWTFRLRRRGVCRAALDWQNRVARLRARLGVSRPVALLESCLAEVPTAFGHLRPVILMPVGLLAGLPTGQMEAILLHELAHIRRNDYLVNALQRSVETLFFYQPAVWWISGVIRTERENCCDDVVVATNGDVQEYAAALTALEQNRWSSHEPALAAAGGDLVKRIRRLLYPKSASSNWTPLFAVVILITTAAVAFAARLPQPARQDSQSESSGKANAGISYSKWLNEDVAYIITPKERSEFLKLKTNRDRDRFINQFWARRNPNPGSAVNKFKVEHYRRIAYANEHFASAKPGWQTDRGRMYIVYGPPDEIDSHPASKLHAYEQWMYRHVEGHGDNWVLTFTDRTGKGDYQLAPASANKKPAKSLVPESGKNGYSFPACLYCPAPQYSAQALERKVQGHLTLTAVITADGRAEDIEAKKGLPYGLTDKAIHALKEWKFKPATGPDGKLAAVRQRIEVTFRLY
jgi:TonB family protein